MPQVPKSPTPSPSKGRSPPQPPNPAYLMMAKALMQQEAAKQQSNVVDMAKRKAQPRA